MNIKQTAIIIGCSLSALLSSCSICSRTAAADYGRSAEAILLPLDKPTLHQVGKEWYIQGEKATVERSNASWISPELLPEDKQHPERYSLADEDFSPVYSPISETLATSLVKGSYTHSDAISFINRKWVDELPEGESKTVRTKVSAPAFFRNMDSHRLLKSEQGNTYLLARIGEMSADLSAVFAYPFAGLCAIIIDTPASLFYSPPNRQIQKAEAEEVE